MVKLKKKAIMIKKKTTAKKRKTKDYAVMANSKEHILSRSAPRRSQQVPNCCGYYYTFRFTNGHSSEWKGLKKAGSIEKRARRDRFLCACTVATVGVTYMHPRKRTLSIYDLQGCYGNVVARSPFAMYILAQSLALLTLQV